MSNSNSVVACGGSDDDRRSLRERMLADLQFRGMAKRTIDGYLREVRKLACYYNTSPDLLTEQQVGDYLLHLVNRNYTPGSLRVASRPLAEHLIAYVPRLRLMNRCKQGRIANMAA